MDRSVDEERSFNGNVSVTTSLNTQAGQDVRVLATVYTIFKIGEFYTVVYQTFYYRPQRSWAKVMFLQASVVLSTGGGVSASVHVGMPDPPGADPPWGQTPPRTRHTIPPRPGTPLDLAHLPRDQAHPPKTWHTTPHDLVHPLEADASIRSMSGRYASYWNAFLFPKIKSQYHIFA